MENANYYGFVDEYGQFKGMIRTILPFPEIAEIAEWRIVASWTDGERNRKVIVNKEGDYVIQYLTDPTKGNGWWFGVGERPLIEKYLP